MIKFYLLTILFTFPVYGEVSCNRYKAVSVCVIDPKLNWGNKAPKIFHSSCKKKGVQSYYIKNSLDLLDRFDALKKQCKKIKNIRFVGHAYAGHTDAGGLTIGDMEFWFDGYDSVFAPKAKIWVTGCNAGKGCLGRVFLYELARIFLTKGGTVIAPDFYIVSPLTGKIDHFSFSGKETVLEYNPLNVKNREIWRYEGLKRFKWKGQGIIKYCQDEIYNLIKHYQLEKTKAFKRGCQITKIPGVEGLRESYLNIHKIFGHLEKKRKKKITKSEKKELDEEYGYALESFDKIKLATKHFRKCKK